MAAKAYPAHHLIAGVIAKAGLSLTTLGRKIKCLTLANKQAKTAIQWIKSCIGKENDPTQPDAVRLQH